jgi:hypothetical protein
VMPGFQTGVATQRGISVLGGPDKRDR